MHEWARVMAVALVLLGSTACFQSDFVLYGPRCTEAKECKGAIGEQGSDERRCFFPRVDETLGDGYCSVSCDPTNPCEAQGEFAVECISRSQTGGGDQLYICALLCEENGDCPDSMTCISDPKGGKSKLCTPS